jgi:hypothetical protein
MTMKVLQSDVYEVTNMIQDMDMTPDDMGQFFAAVALQVFKERHRVPTQSNLEDFAKVFRVPLKKITQELQTRYYDK